MKPYAKTSTYGTHQIIATLVAAPLSGSAAPTDSNAAVVPTGGTA
jgi:hypothetical protein